MIYFLVVAILNECLYMYCIIGQGTVNLKLNLSSQLATLGCQKEGRGNGANLSWASSYEKEEYNERV